MEERWCCWGDEGIVEWARGRVEVTTGDLCGADWVGVAGEERGRSDRVEVILGDRCEAEWVGVAGVEICKEYGEWGEYGVGCDMVEAAA